MGEWKETELRKIPKEWEFLSVGELVEQNIIDKPLDGNHGGIHPKGTDFVDKGIPFIMATDIKNGKVDLVNCKFITKKQADSLNKGFAITDDVLLTHKASLGRTAIVGEMETPYIMLTPQVTYYRVKEKDKLNNKYLKYFFDSPDFQNTLLNHGDSGSTRAYVGITAQRDLPVCLPPTPEQKAIASVLSSLDEKTDLLHRQNKTLEAMAETLFRQWFAEEAHEKCEEKPLDEVAKYLNGLACQKYLPKNDVDKLPVLKIKELRNGFTDNSDWATTDVKESYIVQGGDIIFSWSGSLLVKVWDGRKCVLNQHLFKVTSDTYPKWFIYLWIKFHLEKFIAIAESKATTMGHIKRKDLSHSMVLVPNKQELDHMNSIVYPLIDKIILNNEQLIILGNLRDTLLSKLISGEVRVEYEN